MWLDLDLTMFSYDSDMLSYLCEPKLQVFLFIFCNIFLPYYYGFFLLLRLRTLQTKKKASTFIIATNRR
jgi:hypothetical protein